MDKVNVCSSDKETTTNITALDLDLPPYSAPFHYELLGDVKGKWRIEPNHGTPYNLSSLFFTHNWDNYLHVAWFHGSKSTCIHIIQMTERFYFVDLNTISFLAFCYGGTYTVKSTT